MTIRAFAHGGGVQSTAALVLSAEGRIDFPVHLFCNVGEDSEEPRTLDYVHDVSMPYAAAHGIELVEIRYQPRTPGGPETLYSDLLAQRRSIKIPIHLSPAGAPGARVCTNHFKIRVLGRWLKARGASRDNPAVVGLGISTDEIERAQRGKDEPYERRAYPLLDLGLSRRDCVELTARAGLPPAPRSACWFCPFHTVQDWSEMRRDRPELFERAVALEERLNADRAAMGKDPVFMSRSMRPLRNIHEATLSLFDYDGETCDAGVCFV